MAVDKVKPLGMEEEVSGTGILPLPTELDPSEDYVAAKGIALENLDTYLIDKDASNIQFTDPTVGTKSVDTIRSTVRVSADDTTPDNLEAKVVSGLGIAVTTLNPGANETFEIRNTSGDFGTEFDFDSDESEETTTSTSYIEKLKLTTGSLPAGDYYISWFYEAKTPTGSGKSMDVRIQLDDTTDLAETTVVDTRADYWGISGFAFRTLTTGSHYFDIDYRKNSATASIRRARLITWRIS